MKAGARKRDPKLGNVVPMRQADEPPPASGVRSRPAPSRWGWEHVARSTDELSKFTARLRAEVLDIWQSAYQAESYKPEVRATAVEHATAVLAEAIDSLAELDRVASDLTYVREHAGEIR